MANISWTGTKYILVWLTERKFIDDRANTKGSPTVFIQLTTDLTDGSRQCSQLGEVELAARTAESPSPPVSLQ
ncbi:hypothetical protein CHS0354_026500 [Potamilus streckersoni]|uniref:Uncharacterized protein n=1 Tax=Potamilus streckersoni TaxID=2493646 RepID=A0AAE0RQ32_9BIVA|nr:hypothetical protein CHS0354_026500 [Potamilus streckersoni]